MVVTITPSWEHQDPGRGTNFQYVNIIQDRRLPISILVFSQLYTSMQITLRLVHNSISIKCCMKNRHYLRAEYGKDFEQVSYWQSTEMGLLSQIPRSRFPTDPFQNLAISTLPFCNLNNLKKLLNSHIPPSLYHPLQDLT